MLVSAAFSQPNGSRDKGKTNVKSSQKLMLAVLLLLVGAAVAGLRLTGGSPESGSSNKKHPGATDETRLLDQHLLATAQRLSALAATREERELAQNAERLADRDVDLAFSDALRNASEQSTPSTSKVRALEDRVAQIQSAINTADQEVKALQAETAHARGNRLAYLQGSIELTQAELALDKDELSDARQDLAAAGGGVYNHIEQLWKQHEAAQHPKESTKPASNSSNFVQVAVPRRGLIAGWREWARLRDQQDQLQQGTEGVAHVVQRLTKERLTLQQRIQVEESQKEKMAQTAKALLSVKVPESGANPKLEATTALSLLHQLSLDEKGLSDLNDRILDLQQLDSTYGQWIGLIEALERAALHGMIKSVLWIILVGLMVFLADQAIDRAFTRIRMERKQRATLRSVSHFSLNVLAVLIVLLIVFGPPSQLSTILGLAGAGLTVSLKDFIVSFFGWFILMSRHGIRAGDWVEIDGVSGEVIDISLFRTVLLETGNWNEPGHPTGREVSFLNLYAVEGHYYNFTTSGQWLWDEIKVLIPWGVDPYPIVRKIKDTARTETAMNAKKAEQEWQRATRGYTVKTFSAAPSIKLCTVEDGVEVTIQYIATAIERYQVRLRLSHAAVRLIHEGKTGAPAVESAPEIPSASPTKMRVLPAPDA
jgi:Mechanosensitive ion channel, beta-domain